MFRLFALSLMALMVTASPLLAKGDLSRKCKTLPELVLGTDDAGYKVSQSTYEIETGQCYKLEIKSSGRKEYAMKGPKFFRNMWVRKIEAGGMEIKAAPIDELEFEDEAECELYFTMIVPGEYKFYAAGLEKKGTVVTFKVKK